MSNNPGSIQPWRATCVQITSNLAVLAPDPDAAWKIIQANIAGAVALIEAAMAGPDKPKLFVMPEFGLQGAPLEMPVADWIAQACCAVPGPITAPFQDLARKHGIFIGGNQFEAPPEWPGRYFNTCFLIDPKGDIVLRYRRINTAIFPSPHDFMNDYLAATAPSDVFPVVDTELGRIGMISCGEITVPEVARVMMMQGAEIILHPNNGPHTLASDAAKVSRATENLIYLVSANVAGPIGFSVDRTEPGGRSRILDWRGNMLAYQEEAVESTSVTAMIDIEALRRARLTDSGPSSLLRSRFEMYRPFYQAASFYPANAFRKNLMTGLPATEIFIEQSRQKLLAAKILTNV